MFNKKNLGFKCIFWGEITPTVGISFGVIGRKHDPIFERKKKTKMHLDTDRTI